MQNSKSILEFERAKNLMPGGVNSPVRAFRNVNSDPIFIKRAEGSKIFDVDGNEFIDYVGSWGPISSRCKIKICRRKWYELRSTNRTRIGTR